MSLKIASAVNARQLAFVYTAAFVIGMIFQYVVGLAVLLLFSIDLGSMLTIVMVIFVSACFVGHFWLLEGERRPRSSERWGVTFLLSVVNVVLYGLAIWISHYVSGGMERLFFALDTVPLRTWAFILTPSFVVSVITIRLGVATGLKLAAM